MLYLLSMSHLFLTCTVTIIPKCHEVIIFTLNICGVYMLIITIVISRTIRFTIDVLDICTIHATIYQNDSSCKYCFCRFIRFFVHRHDFIYTTLLLMVYNQDIANFRMNSEMYCRILLFIFLVKLFAQSNSHILDREGDSVKVTTRVIESGSSSRSKFDLSFYLSIYIFSKPFSSESC